MSRFTALSVVLIFGFAMAWAQAPAAQPAAAAPAAQTSSISGCMTQSFGIFTVPSAGKNWSVKGDGASLWNFDNHVVKVQGIVDPKAANPVLYAQSVQDTGQPCGSAAVATASPNAAGTPAAANAANTAAAPMGANSTATAPASATTATTPSTTTAEPQQQPGGGVAQNTSPEMSQTSAAQSGTTGVTTPAPQTSENKGTPAAGSPTSGAIASDSASNGASTSSAAPAENYATFNGCLLGSVNDYQFKSNGKTYRLQGNTSQLNSLFKRNVELTGEDFNGKAIEVNGARDLGSSCK
jgi:hypothetical protein